MTIRKLLAPTLAASILAGCATTSSQQTSRRETARIIVAAMDVAISEHCGRSVKAELVKKNLSAHQSKIGFAQKEIEASAIFFDLKRDLVKHQIRLRPDFCARDTEPRGARIAMYEKGEFPNDMCSVCAPRQ